MFYKQNHLNILKIEKVYEVIFMYYIKETDKPSKIAKWLHIVKLENETIILPITKTSLDEKMAYKLAIKTKTILDKTNSKKLVLSKQVKQQENYVNYLYSYNYEIVDGRWLFQMLLFDVLKYVIKKLKIKEEEIKIGILVNNISDLAIYTIQKLVTKYKYIKIVTNHIERFRNIEEKFSEEQGIFINVGNNKRKILSKTNIILNLDFPTELINRYTINSTATIINFKGNVQIKNKRFNGLNINDYEIDWKTNPHLEEYEAKDVYEAMQYKNQPIEEIFKKIKRDNVTIQYLKGIKTII